MIFIDFPGVILAVSVLSCRRVGLGCGFFVVGKHQKEQITYGTLWNHEELHSDREHE
jgi:predicted small metal-binding protein